MLFILIISIIPMTIALEPKLELAGEQVRNIFHEYITKIPDIQEKYIIDERLSNVISRYFKGAISTFPLFKISLKIDRNPVKIPWTLGQPGQMHVKKNKKVRKKYKLLRNNAADGLLSSSKKSNTDPVKENAKASMEPKKITQTNGTVEKNYKRVF